MMPGRFLFSKSPFFSIVLFLYVASSSLVILCQGLAAAAAAEGGGGGAAAVVLRRGVGDDEGGSGFGEVGDSEDLEEEGEEEQEDGSNSQLVMPTRVVPSLRTPLIGEVEEGSSKGKNTAADMAVVYPTAAAAPPADDSDLIFVSGDTHTLYV